MSDKVEWATTVIDAGARYGIHPSWHGFRAPLDYFLSNRTKQKLTGYVH